MTVTGFLNIDKPPGLTSHDVVARVRRITRRDTDTKKVGHAGTLDPMATGVLVVCVGHATRLSEYAMHGTKGYRAVVHLGIETDSYDADGDVTAQTDASHITHADIERVLPSYIGDIQQVPPMYSAIKKDGKKLYELARAGQEIEREARPVTIHHINIVRWSPPQVTLDVACSSGTYIRSLAYDIGRALGCGAHLAGLIRTRSGAFTLENATALDDLLNDEAWQRHLIAPQQALSDLPTITLTDEDAQEIQYGRMIARTDAAPNTETVMAYMGDGHLLAVLEKRGIHWKPHKVFLPDA